VCLSEKLFIVLLNGSCSFYFAKSASYSYKPFHSTNMDLSMVSFASNFLKAKLSAVALCPKYLLIDLFKTANTAIHQ